mmetsp:Transcript_3622/g.9514  ORF Transcript_3622/g.9514 Transcript_3622/m.9514 type:complete len:220 (+) Transcript_3622:1772-2431(+)
MSSRRRACAPHPTFTRSRRTPHAGRRVGPEPVAVAAAAASGGRKERSSLGPRPSGADAASRIVGVLDVDPGLAGVLVGLPGELLQLLEPALALRDVLLDGERVDVVLVRFELLPDLLPEVLLVVRHRVADALEEAAVEGEHREPVDELLVGGDLPVVEGGPPRPLRPGPAGPIPAGGLPLGVRGGGAAVLVVVVVRSVVFDVDGPHRDDGAGGGAGRRR